MTDISINLENVTLHANDADHALEASVREFVGSSADYYVAEFGKIQESKNFSWSFNWAAALLGPIWAAGRGLWALVCVLILVEMVALAPLAQGLWKDLGTAQTERIEKLQINQAGLRERAQTALDTGDEELGNGLNERAKKLDDVIGRLQSEADEANAFARTMATLGLVAFVAVKLAEGLLANMLYERRYTQWRYDKTIDSGLNWLKGFLGVGMVAIIYILTLYNLTVREPIRIIAEFPNSPKGLYEPVARSIDRFLDYLIVRFAGVFDGLSRSIRITLEGIETLLLATPWPVVMTIIVVIAWRLANPRVAIFTAASLFYIAMLDYWELAMVSVALLGTATFLCLAIGIPLGIWFSRSDRAYAFGRPVLDFMQTVPSFVYLIPVIAFFGVGKPSGIIVAVIFGLPPVVRLTNLGLRQTPDHVKEAAAAFGANKWQILRDVELPLAMPSILTGINQTILFCWAALVIAALIGAGGLGYEVLQALSFAAKGQGILAGVATLLCAMVIDRIVQNAYKHPSDRT